MADPDTAVVGQSPEERVGLWLIDAVVLVGPSGGADRSEEQPEIAVAATNAPTANRWLVTLAEFGTSSAL